LALGERARDLIDRLQAEGAEVATAAELAALPGPVMRPLAAGAQAAARQRDVYRLPVQGRLVTGFGEVSDTGVHSRGLTFAVPPGARVLAPAGGTVRYARAFRGYGGIVIIDHGQGWTSLVTGMSRLIVAPDAVVGQGTPLGIAASGEEPTVTLELRRRGRPVDAAALLG
jgi:septal ring factor EnvC (AmiA/AmiB activator)